VPSHHKRWPSSASTERFSCSPKFLQFSLGYSALRAGVCILPVAGAFALTAPLSALIMKKISIRYTVAAGLAIVAGGF
jgi:hypothetical protein